MAVAANFRKFPEAQMRQMELDLSGVVGASDEQRGCFWTWLMDSCKVKVLPVFPVPQWVKVAKRKAAALARAVKAAILEIFG